MQRDLVKQQPCHVHLLSEIGKVLGYRTMVYKVQTGFKRQYRPWHDIHTLDNVSSVFFLSVQFLQEAPQTCILSNTCCCYLQTSNMEVRQF